MWVNKNCTFKTFEDLGPCLAPAIILLLFSKRKEAEGRRQDEEEEKAPSASACVRFHLIDYLAPVSHFPASTGAEVASLSRVRPLEGHAIGIHLRAALHTSPVGAQPTRGGTLQGGGEKTEAGCGFHHWDLEEGAVVFQLLTQLTVFK